MLGDGTITARVVSQDATNARAKAGIMISESLAADARELRAAWPQWIGCGPEHFTMLVFAVAAVSFVYV